jgi:predicted MFS family arabinose efflux permease
MVGAIARAAVLPASQAVVVTAFSDEDARRRAIGWVTSGLSAAGLVGIPIMTSLAGFTSWRVSFFAMGALALVMLLLSTLLAWWSRAGESQPVRAAAL